MPEKLKYIQKKHATKYIDERGPIFDSMIQNLLALMQDYFKIYPE